MIIFKQMTYSPDFRKKVLMIKEQEGLTQAEAAVRFRVGGASAWNPNEHEQNLRPK